MFLVPAAGLEPARIIHPPDFESGTSTNFITRGHHKSEAADL